MRAMLETEGFAVRTARSGDEAVRMFQEKRPDVVLLDVMMPGKGGIQTCSELRGIDKLAPILFLTAVPSDTTKVRAFGAGADDYIEKTCNPDVLVARIRAALRRDLAGTTTVIVSHRITTLLDCDSVLVLEKGRVAQLGAPAELLAREGLFRRIYDLQMAVGEEAEA